MNYRALTLVAVAVGLGTPSLGLASYGLFVGKNLTEDGSTMLGGSGDEPSSHWLVIQPRETHEAGTTITVGITGAADMPGILSAIPQVPVTYRYIAHYYSEFAGFPAPLTNGGLNDHQVAARDVWAPSRPELVEMTPNPQTGGPQYSDLSRIIMQRAATAREAVEIIGALIDEHGFQTYGGNSHLIADPEEGWVLIEFAGGVGLWIAERLGPNDVKFLCPGYILELPVDWQESGDYLASPNFMDFAVEQGWYDAEAGEPFNVNAIYGNGRGRSDEVVYVEEAVANAAPISLEEMKAFIRDPRISLDTTGYGQVAHLRADLEPELSVLWAAATNSSIAPFVPYYIGTESLPLEYGYHRYLSAGEAAGFQSAQSQVQEGTRYAFREFKRLMYLACDENAAEYYPPVRAAFEGFEARMRADQPYVEATARALMGAGERDYAIRFLTAYSTERSMEGLRLGQALAVGIEAHARVVHGLRGPDEPTDRRRVWCEEPLAPGRR